MLLEGKSAVIYGGGSIGGAVARAFAREGAKVFLTGRTLATLDEVAGEIRSERGVVDTAQVDALYETAVEEHADAVAASAGSIDISFNLISQGDVQGTPLRVCLVVATPIAFCSIEGSTTVAKLTYLAITSLDGYTADEDGNFDWAAPDEEVHAFVNDLARPLGTYLYGRRMYETMVYWETAHTLADQLPVEQDFTEIWQAAEKIVYSTTLETVSSARTRIEQDFDPDVIREMKASAQRDINVGGPDLAAQAFKAGLVDEIHLFVAPIVVGGGKQSFPDDISIKLELLNERRFGNGMVHFQYRTRA